MACTERGTFDLFWCKETDFSWGKRTKDTAEGYAVSSISTLLTNRGIDKGRFGFKEATLFILHNNFTNL